MSLRILQYHLLAESKSLSFPSVLTSTSDGTTEALRALVGEYPCVLLRVPAIPSPTHTAAPRSNLMRVAMGREPFASFATLPANHDAENCKIS